ncbi:MAG: BAX inhibitor (BI)-1/YccA family protein, partial [Veillonella sp.]
MEYHIPTQADTVVVEEIVNRKLRNSMLWMVWGLLTTAIIGFMALTNSSWLRFAHSNFNIILLAEVGVVFLFSFRQYTASNTFLKAMFFLYSIMNGLTLTAIALHYSFEVVVYALTGAVAVFGSFAFLGVVVKKDLSGLGTFLMGAVIALLIASLIMMFFGASDF